MPPPRNAECFSSVTLKGPYSPLEMRIHCLTRCGTRKNVSVEWGSVNAVLLDTDPQDSHDRLVVAGHVGESADGERLSLRHTTIMPAVHGFLSLAALIFCPRACVANSDDSTRPGAVLCGLGYREDGRSLYPDHDMCIPLDFVLRQDDLDLVNEMREQLNLSVTVMDEIRLDPIPITSNDTGPRNGTRVLENCQRRLAELLRQLMTTRRDEAERCIPKGARHWQEWTSDHLFEDDLSCIWPRHPPLPTVDATDEVGRRRERERHLSYMLDMAKTVVKFVPHECCACDVSLNTIEELRVHLASRLHRSNL